jgi:FAD/FMN-containing dehydrogenase
MQPKGATMSAQTFDTLAGQLSGSIVLPSHSEYDQARTLWNGMIDKRPAAIARCASAEDVARVVSFAREQGYQLAVRAGGHNAAGSALCDDGLVVDLTAMRAVSVDPDSRTARAQGGATWADFDQATSRHDLATT